MKIVEFARRYAQIHYPQISENNLSSLNVKMVSDFFDRVAIGSKQERRQLYSNVFAKNADGELILNRSFEMAVIGYANLISDNLKAKVKQKSNYNNASVMFKAHNAQEFLTVNNLSDSPIVSVNTTVDSDAGESVSPGYGVY